MREINEIIIHCTGNTPNSTVNAAAIDKFHRKERGWKSIGYHYVILPDGTIEAGRDLDQEGSHCKAKNKNKGTIAIAYVGGLRAPGEPADTRTPQQRNAIRQLVYLLSCLFPIVRVTGHNDYTDTKPCPCFDVKADQDIQDAWNFGRHHTFAVTFPLRTDLTRAFYLAKSQAKVVPINHV